MFDYDEAFHDLEQLDSRGRQAAGAAIRSPSHPSGRFVMQLFERQRQSLSTSSLSRVSTRIGAPDRHHRR